MLPDRHYRPPVNAGLIADFSAIRTVRFDVRDRTPARSAKYVDGHHWRAIARGISPSARSARPEISRSPARFRFAQHGETAKNLNRW